jgi:hypothetical protein
MKSILHGLYNGDIIPWERRNPNSEKHREILRKIEDEERYFMAKMSLDDCERFQALSSLHMEFSTAEEDNLFSYAFALGMLLALDVMKEAEVIANE